MMKSFFVVSAVLLASACSASNAHSVDGHSPYGIWVTQRGHVIVITRDQNYTYCGKQGCMQGVFETRGVLGVTLKGFMVNPATSDLRAESGEDELSRAASKPGPDFDFTEQGSGMSSELRKSLCDDRPCVTIGNLETNVHRFIKIEDF